MAFIPPYHNELISLVDAVLLVSTAEPDPVHFTVTTFIDGNQNRSNYVATYGSATRVSFPADSVYVTNSSQRHRAILVQAEEGKTISVYGVSGDGFVALSCDGMRVNNVNRYEYVIFSAGVMSESYKSEFLIIPCTRIDITPSQLVTVEADDFKTTQFGLIPHTPYCLQHGKITVVIYQVQEPLCRSVTGETLLELL